MFGNTYSEKNIHILSSNVSRTILSATSTVKGIFSTSLDNQESLNGCDIKIETIGKKEDNMFYENKPCKRIEDLQSDLLKSEPFASIMNSTFYEYLSNASGTPINDLEWAFFLYDTLDIEANHNLQLPEWTKNIYPEKLEHQALYYLLLKTYNGYLTRLKVGLIWDRIMTFLNIFISNPNNSPKIFLISGHQQTLVNILNSIGVFDHHPPSFSSSIIFELWRNNAKKYYLETYFKNDTHFISFNFSNCSKKCDLLTIVKILEPITITQEDWEHECQQESSLNRFTVIIIIVVAVLFIYVIVYCTCTESRKKYYLLGRIN